LPQFFSENNLCPAAYTSEFTNKFNVTAFVEQTCDPHHLSG
jgi:hypothetical protein